MSTLQNTRILLVGGSSGIARRIAEDALAAGAEVFLGSRRPEALADTVAELGSGASAMHLDLDDESSIAAAVTTLGPLDHVVSLAANHANGPVTALDRAAVEGAFAAKVVGPILLAKHFAPTLRDGGSFVFFSGVAAWKPAPGLAVMATTNGAVAFLAEALAVELAPLRVNAVSPGIVDSGAWDGMGDGKQAMFDATAAKNPARRVGRPDDVSAAVLLALTNGFVTGTTLHVDGGGRLS
ncbi:SDR family oxidoreductase [Rhodococcus sp. SORGH_AS_0301]|uniref:SDR family oxidoreductase n=1 Tax=Rhodococcus sp. SORGH_AS_0301 TaxID=3041780 RepID=UPI00277DA1AA|nr:SDR family oxidoreductase [Rhodococcus sp. SORGH_AS_0301]MDQ1181889.1 NAD(P)-dependent dehydrogenase (short-subunit alcohol dehydrogenase family) [Rhodococcus sp. SORGH_AS_0301]